MQRGLFPKLLCCSRCGAEESIVPIGGDTVQIQKSTHVKVARCACENQRRHAHVECKTCGSEWLEKVPEDY